ATPGVQRERAAAAASHRWWGAPGGSGLAAAASVVGGSVGWARYPRPAMSTAPVPAARRRPRTPAGRARRTHELLAVEYPGTAKELCALVHRNPYELLAATILSAQCTDERVNQVTPRLFERYPTPEDLAAAEPTELEEIIRPTGFYKNKARSLIGMAAGVVERFGGEVPSRMSDLVTLPGVGRKTANVLRSVA